MRFWYKYYISELLHGADKKWLTQLVQGFPKPDLIIYLDIKPTTSLKRKIEISEYESGHHQNDKAQGFIEFQNKSMNIWDELKSSDWITVDSELSPEDVKSQTLKLILDIL
jgi:thymidylate kinase